MTYLIHTISDTITGEITRYVIAQDGLTLGLDISETVSARRPLSDVFGTDYPVTVVARQPPMDRRIRIKVENWREEQGGAVPEAVDGEGLAQVFFKPLM